MLALDTGEYAHGKRCEEDVEADESLAALFFDDLPCRVQPTSRAVCQYMLLILAIEMTNARRRL